MKIGELSKITGASIRSIRHYEEKNLLTAKRLENGYRDFDQSAIDRIRNIQLYLGLGLTTDEIAEIFLCHPDDELPEYDELCEEMVDLYREKIEELNRKIEALSAIRNRLEDQLYTLK